VNILEQFPSKFIKAADLNGKDWTLTIDRVEVEIVGPPDDQEEKPILHFQGAKRGLLLNKTNALTLAALYGPETDHWTGKQITLYPAKVQAFGGIVDAVRIRDRAPASTEQVEKKGEAEPANDQKVLFK